jgi:hypothetical protein
MTDTLTLPRSQALIDWRDLGDGLTSYLISGPSVMEVRIARDRLAAAAEDEGAEYAAFDAPFRHQGRWFVKGLVRRAVAMMEG